MTKNILLILIFFITIPNTYAQDVKQIASSLGLYAGTKATIQWERIFSSQRRMQKYNIDKLSNELKNKLQIYLIKHAADSNQPIVPGL